MNKIAFITTNEHKFKEVKEILKNYPIELEHLAMEYEENHDESMEEIAEKASRMLASTLNKPVLLEDTGLFFDAFDGFPGALPKFVFRTLGYRGILKLLKDEKRGAIFKTIAAYCEPGNDPVLFEGIMKGEIGHEVMNPDKDAMQYDRIFIPEGENITITEMTLEKKNFFSQRAQAFKKFGEYFLIRKNQAASV
jgi:XTP/dITP diphosphohydrolase